MMPWALIHLVYLALTFQGVLGLNESHGFKIGVVLGSIIGALLAVAIIAFIFYMFCIRRWLGVGEPPELGYARQNDYNLKKQTNVRPTNFGFGARNQGSAPPYSAGDQKDSGRRQGTANSVYQHDEKSKPQQHYPVGAAPPYNGHGGGGGEPVVLSGGGDRLRHSSHSPDDMSYSSESGGGGRQGYEVTSTRTYQARNYTAHATKGGGGDSPVSAAYLGTGV